MPRKNLPALDDLSKRINAEHEACQTAMRSAVDHAMRAGELLIEAKAGLAHGQWLPWLEGSCGVSERTAQAYMRLARELPKLEPEDAQRVADLPLRQVLAELAEPKSNELLQSEDVDLDIAKAVCLESLERTVDTLEQVGWTPVEIGVALAWITDRQADIRKFFAFDEEYHRGDLKSELTLMRELRRFNLCINRGQPPAAALLERLGQAAAERKLFNRGLEELPPGLSAVLTVNKDGGVTVKPEFVFAMAASPKASVQAMITAQILGAAPGAEMTPTSLRLPENLPFENWARIGELLMAMPGSEAAIQNAAGQRP